MRDTIAMPPRKTYPGVLFPLTLILLVILIGMGYTIITMQTQLSEQQDTLLSVNNQVQQLNQIVLGADVSQLLEDSDTNPGVLAEEKRKLAFDETGVSFDLPVGFLEIGDPVLSETTDADLHTSYVYKDDIREYYTFTIINGTGQADTLDVSTWKLSAKITVAERDAEMYKGNESLPESELYIVPADGAEVGFLFQKNDKVTTEPDLTFDEAIATMLASVSVIEAE